MQDGQRGKDSPVLRCARGAKRGDADSCIQDEVVMETNALIARESNGRFPKGMSGNPSGKPSDLKAITELARSRAPEMLKALAEIALDTSQPVFARISAAQHVLDRGLGKPTASVDLNVTDAQRTAELALVLRELGGMSFRKDVIDVESVAVESKDE